MLYAVMDIGSNSVRLMMSEDERTLSKEIITTQIAQNLANTDRLSAEAIERTTLAVVELKRRATAYGAEEIYVFATEAVRSSSNGADFTARVYTETGLTVDVLTSREEALLGFSGAYQNGTCAVVDIGGASTELVVGNKKKILYAHSEPIGVVKIRDAAGENCDKIISYAAPFLKRFGSVPISDMLLAIGGTASAIAAIKLKLKTFDSAKVHLSILRKNEILSVAETVLGMSVERRKTIAGLEEKRADIIVGGAVLLTQIMDMLGYEHLLVSELDNLEGYLKRRVLYRFE